MQPWRLSTCLVSGPCGSSRPKQAPNKHSTTLNRPESFGFYLETCSLGLNLEESTWLAWSIIQISLSAVITDMKNVRNVPQSHSQILLVHLSVAHREGAGIGKRSKMGSATDTNGHMGGLQPLSFNLNYLTKEPQLGLFGSFCWRSLTRYWYALRTDHFLDHFVWRNMQR